MDSLKCYGSDSESNEENGESIKKVLHDKSEDISGLSINKVSTSNDVDFFGLHVSLRQTNKPVKNSQKDEIKKVNFQYGEIELPNSNFWKDFIPNNLQDNYCVETSHSQYFHFQTANATTNCNSSNFSTSSQYRPGGKRTQPSPEWPLYKKQCIGTTSSDVVSQIIKSSEDRENDTITRAVKKKLYYVHSKVAPYLNLRTSNKCSSQLEKSWSAHVGAVNRLAWNVPNYSHLLATAGMDACIRLWNVWSRDDEAAATFLCHKKAVTHIDWCLKGSKILSCSFDRTALVTDVETSKCTAHCEHMGHVTCACLHPSNPNLFVSGTENMICMWDTRTSLAPVKHFTYKDNIGQIQDILFIRNGEELISCCDLVCRDSADRSIMAWDVKSGVVLSNQIYQERYTCTRLKLHPAKTHFLAQTQGDYAAIFSTTAPYKLNKSKRYDGHKVQGYRIGLDISPNGNVVYSGSASGSVHCYDEYCGKLIHQLNCNNDIVLDVACHPVLSSLTAACTWGGQVYLWH